jgi:exodeoxyribonuclease X
MLPRHIPDDAPWTVASFSIVDVEGNGGQPSDLVELAVIHVDAGVAATAKSWLVRPNQEISVIATRIHGIKNADVAGAPQFDVVCSEVTASLKGRYLVAHNAAVDWGVLQRKLPGLQLPGVIDTLRLARSLWPGQKSYALGKLLVALGLDGNLHEAGTGPHRAEYDATAALQLFLHLAMRSPRGPLTFRQLIELGDLTYEVSQGSLF